MSSISNTTNFYKYFLLFFILILLDMHKAASLVFGDAAFDYLTDSSISTNLAAQSSATPEANLAVKLS